MQQILPVVEKIESFTASQTVECLEDRHLLLIVMHGHVSIAFSGEAPLVFTQAFACHPAHGPVTIQTPRTKAAEYVIISYHLLPRHSEWTLHGQLTTISDYKIKYMVDELLRRTRDTILHTAEDEAIFQVRKRMMFERILFIYLYESRITQVKKSAFESIEETLSYMTEHYMVELSLPMLARRAGMSVGHYTVLFKKHTGTTMTAYLHALHIEKAKELLLQNELLAKEVAQRVGFVDYFHFSKVFKKITGQSPTAFQQQLNI